jgi:hypothetical protein
LKGGIKAGAPELGEAGRIDPRPAKAAICSDIATTAFTVFIEGDLEAREKLSFRWAAGLVFGTVSCELSFSLTVFPLTDPKLD